jgi:hypothetical protein
MKILYISHDRQAAELANVALRTVAPDTAVTWAAGLGGARRWIEENRRVAAVIVEVDSDDPTCEAFIQHVRGLGVAAPMIVVSTQDPAPPLTALRAAADQVSVKDRTFLNDLPFVVSRALHLPPPAARAPRRRVLYVGDAALARECLARPGGSIDVIEAEMGPNGTFEVLPPDARPLAFDILLIEHGYPGVETLPILKEIIARKLQVPVVIVAEWVEDLAVLTAKLGVVDYVVKSKASFRAFVFRLNRLLAHSERRTLEAKLAEAEASHQRAEKRAIAEQHAARLEATERQVHLEAELARAASNSQLLVEQLAEARIALDRAEDAHAAELRNVERRLADAEASRASAKEIDEIAQINEQTAAKLAAAERQIAEAAAALQRATEQHAAEMRDAAARLSEHQHRADARLAQAAAAHDALQAKLIEGAAALQRVEQQAAADRQAAAEEAAQRRARSDAELTEEVSRRQSLVKQLADTEAARRRADEQHAADVAAVTTRFTGAQTHLEARLAEAVAGNDALQTKLIESVAALQHAQQQAIEERQAAIEDAAHRRVRFDADLAEAVAKTQTLTRQLADAEAARRTADADHAAEMTAATARFAEAQAQLETRLAQSGATVDMLRAKVMEGAAALERVEQQAAADRQAAAEEAAQRRATFEAELMHAVTREKSLANQLTEAESARRQADDKHAGEIAAATMRLADVQAQADARLTQAVADADALRAKVIEGAAALQRVEQQAAADRQAASEESAQRRATYDAELAQAETRAQTLARQLADNEAARRQADEHHATELAAASTRLAEAQAQAEVRLAQAIAAADARLTEYQELAETRLTQALAEAATTLQNAEQQASSERHAAAEQAAQLQAAFDAELRQEVARRQVVESEIADTRLASEQAERRFVDEVTAMRQRARDHEARLEEHAARERAEWERTLSERQERIGHLQMEIDSTRQSLAARDEQIQRLEATSKEERADAERARMVLLAERARLEKVVAQRDAELADQAARNTASEEAAAKSAAILKAQAEQVPALRKQVDDLRAEIRRLFDFAPVSLCRCGPNGAVLQVNHALARLLKYDGLESMKQVDFAASVFESGDELQWLVDRSLASNATESVETTWKRQDGSRAVVRLLATPASPESVEVVVEDITSLRTIEEKLKHSQRMEAVARYASEVAVTCDNLLRDVKQQGQQWLTAVESEVARYHGELILGDVTRAAGYLRELSVYGNKEKNVPELVDVNSVLRDLEPVLKRVAGSSIDIVLPQTTAPIDLDVELERVERMLVNIAAYGRERMPHGGRLLIDVASVVVDRKFVAKYPNVRSGAHVLLTVTERKGERRPGVAADGGSESSSADAASPSEKPGVDLGVLQALVSDCGGHLWMEAEPRGDMVLKIHLPRRALDRAESLPAKRPARARWLSKISGARNSAS